jgi:membrane protein
MDKKRVRRRIVFYIRRVGERFLQDDVGAMAAETTYYLILGLIPFLIFLINSVLFFAAPQVPQILHLLQYLPKDLASAMETNVYRIIEGRSSALLVMGLIVALWSASQGVDVLIRAADKAFSTDRNIQTWIWVKCKSLLFTMLLAFTMALSLGMVVFANAVVYALNYYFALPPVFLGTWTLLKYVIPFTNTVITLAVFYRYAPKFLPHQGRTSWVQTLLSAFTVTVLWMILTAGYGYYMLNISNMGVTYGSLVGLMVLFIWFHLSAVVIILGSEMIVAWDEMRFNFAVNEHKTADRRFFWNE